MADSTAPWTVRRLLEWTGGFFTRKEVDQPRLSAELLLAHVLDCPRLKLYTDYERVVGDRPLATFRDLVRRAGEEEPIAYLTGRAHFYTLEIDVTRDVLIPRPDTETLVENVAQTVRHQPGLEAARVLDLCTGSGCVAIAIAKHVRAATVLATDVSEAAAAVARRNVEMHKLGDRITVAVGDLFAPIATVVDARPFDLIVSNPPYIATDLIPKLDRSVRDYEPRLALDGGPDGLDLHRRILAKAADHLTPTGRVFLEIAFDQGPAAVDATTAAGAFDDVRLLKDFNGHDRVLTARRR